MADEDFMILSSLKSEYPSVPSTVVLKVINKFDNNQEKCRQALEIEKRKYPPSDDVESSSSNKSSSACNNNVNNCALESPGEGGSILSRIRQLEVSHVPAAHTPDRHISSYSVSGGTVANNDADFRKPPHQINQSVSWSVHTKNMQTPTSNSPAASQPQTAPVTADFTPFLFTPDVKDIPQIDCNTHTPGRFQQPYGASPRHGGVPSSSSMPSLVNSSSEQRRPVKVINIPPGSLSGGSVSPAPTPPNPRQFRMHFGDTGGICTVSTQPQSNNLSNSNFRTELHTETSSPAYMPAHSSSITCNPDSSSPSSSQNTRTVDGVAGNRRAPPVSLNTAGVYNGPHENLSFPVQASSPGTIHSKPMFVEIRRDFGPVQNTDLNNTGAHQSPAYFTNTIGRTGPVSTMRSYNPVTGQTYLTHYNHDFSGRPTGFPQGHQISEQQYPTNPPVGLSYLDYSANSYHQNSGPNNPPSSYQHHFNNNMYPGYTSIADGNHVGQGGSHPHLHRIGACGAGGGNFNTGQAVITYSTSIGSRSNSQDSEHSSGAATEYLNTSRVSSHGSPMSDTTSHPLVDGTRERSRSGSSAIHEESDYVRALLQHQKSQCQKMREETSKLGDILNSLRSEVSSAERNFRGSTRFHSFPTPDDIAKLSENNRSLQTDIQVYMNELEMYKQGQVPPDEINPLSQQNFFENMPTGQQGPIYPKTNSVLPTREPPPRPPPPIPVRQRSTDGGIGSCSGTAGGVSHHHINTNTTDIYRVIPVPPPQPTINSGESEEGERWPCKACTFLNFPDLNECEMCGLLRDPHQPLPSSSLSSSIPTSSAFVTSASPGLFGTGGRRNDEDSPPALPPHHPLTALPPRLAPGIIGGAAQGGRSRSPSADRLARQLPPPSSNHHPYPNHRAGT